MSDAIRHETFELDPYEEFIYKSRYARWMEEENR